MAQLPRPIWEAKNKLRRFMTHLGRRVRRQQRIIVSVTTYPARIASFHLVLRSLLAQHTLPDLIVIWLAKSDFPNLEKDLPDDVLHLLAHDVQIRWVDDDLRPHKKYFWALQEFADCIVITVDDDIIYRNTMISDLMSSYHANPDCICAIRTHLITFDESGQVAPYDQWLQGAVTSNHHLLGMPSFQLLAVGNAGVLYPSRIMPPNTFDITGIQSCALNGDDLWLKVIELLHGIPVVSASLDQTLHYIPGSQKSALYLDNIYNGNNDRMLHDILQYCSSKTTKKIDFPSLLMAKPL